jgi:hypothetical protein
MLKLIQQNTLLVATLKKTMKEDIIREQSIFLLNIRGRITEQVIKLRLIINPQVMSVDITKLAITQDHTTKEPNIQEEDMWEVITTDTIGDILHQKDTDHHTHHQNMWEANMSHLYTKDQNILLQYISHQFTTQLFMNLQFIRSLNISQKNTSHLCTQLWLKLKIWLWTAAKEKHKNKEFRPIQMENWLMNLWICILNTTHPNKVYSVDGTKQSTYNILVKNLILFWIHIIEHHLIDANRDVCRILIVMPFISMSIRKSVITLDMTGAKIIRPVILDKKEKLGTLSSAQQMYGLLLKNQSLVSGKYIITLSSRMVKLD